MRKISFITSLMMLLVFHSCKMDNEILDVNEKTREIIGESYFNDRSSNEGMIVLGAKLNDPYRYETMLRAQNELLNERSYGYIPPLRSTYKYVRVLPVDEYYLDLIKADTNIVFFDYPLHYEIASMGTYYHDPSIADSLPTWQYCVIPSNYSFPVGVKFELIYDLYFPPEVSDDTFYTDLEERAFKITGNLDENYTRASSWRPSATIKAYDDVVEGYIPLHGVKVIARRFTKVKEGLTDEKGYCVVNGTFKYPVNYSIKWERAYWDIRSGAIWQAYTDGPKIRGKWTLNIDKGSKSLMFATIHRAAYKFYYGNCLGLRRPILSIGKTKIHYKDSYGTGVYWGNWSILGILPDIKIWGKKSDGTYKETNYVYGTTIHELGHQSHALHIGTINFWQNTKFIYESWATAVEWKLTNHHYNVELAKNASCVNYNHENGRQLWTNSAINIEYTPVFIDLIDDFNQANVYGSDYINDEITGYSLSYIQNKILDDTYGLHSLSLSLKANKKGNTTDSSIHNLLLKYYGHGF